MCVPEPGLESSPGQENQKTDLHAMFERLKLTERVRSSLDRNQVKREITALWSEYGPIPAEFLEDSLKTGVDGNTIKWANVVIGNIRKWISYDSLERESFRDATAEEREQEETRKNIKKWEEREKAEAEKKKAKADSGKIYSKFNGAERVKCPDGVYRDAAQPAENGAGRPATEILAEMGMRPDPAPPREKTPEEIQAKKDRRKQIALANLQAKKTKEIDDAVARYIRTYRDWETDRKSTRLNSSHRL